MAGTDADLPLAVLDGIQQLRLPGVRFNLEDVLNESYRVIPVA